MNTKLQIPDNIPHNSSALVFPTDAHGLTSKLKKEMIALASRVKGNEEKMILVYQTLNVLLGHLNSKYLDSGGVFEVEKPSKLKGNKDVKND